MRFTDSQKSDVDYQTTKEGYLVVKAKLSKLGVCEYKAEDLKLNEKGKKEVLRSENSLFSNETIKSFENRPVTLGHPPEFLNAKNWKKYAVGNVTNVHRDGDFLCGDICITDEHAIKVVKDLGVKELSCGYDAEIKEILSGKADYELAPMVANHIAIVNKGRNGSSVALQDEAEDEKMNDEEKSLLKSLLKLLKGENKETPQNEPQAHETEKPTIHTNETTKEPTDKNMEELQALKTELETLKAENEKLTAELTVLNEEKLKAKEEQELNSIQSEVKAVMPDFDFSGMTLRQIKETFIKKLGVADDETINNLSDEVLNGMYLGVKANAKVDKAEKSGEELGKKFVEDEEPKTEPFDYNKMYGA